MKLVFATISAVLLAGSLGSGVADAMPRLDSSTTAPVTAPAIEKTRLVCNYRRCWHTGYYYHPYVYRPYVYRPHLGIGIGPFGVGVY